MIRKNNVSKPLKEDYIIRIKSRIEQRLDEPAAKKESKVLCRWQMRKSIRQWRHFL